MSRLHCSLICHSKVQRVDNTGQKTHLFHECKAKLGRIQSIMTEEAILPWLLAPSRSFIQLQPSARRFEQPCFVFSFVFVFHLQEVRFLREVRFFGIFVSSVKISWLWKGSDNLSPFICWFVKVLDSSPRKPQQSPEDVIHSDTLWFRVSHDCPRPLCSLSQLSGYI